MKNKGGALGSGLPLSKYKQKMAEQLQDDDSVFDWQGSEDALAKEAHYYKWLKKKAAEYDTTVAALCRDAGVNIGTVLYWRHGNPNTLTTVFKIERALEINHRMKEHRDRYRGRNKTAE